MYYVGIVFIRRTLDHVLRGLVRGLSEELLLGPV